ncbi:MAG: aldo/keto reductase [candidate division Zixibacteria bacterium]|nr:aldo/keto reductase [candidate division Zixibacteria bacterium]
MKPTDTAEIRQTGLKITRLGLGGAPLAGLFSGVSPEQATATIESHLDRGMNFMDTAPMYAHGLSELRMGRVLSKRNRDTFVLATKVGRLLEPDPKPDSGGLWNEIPPYRWVFDFSYDAAMRSLEESLKRLNLDRVDILHIHDPDNHYDEAMRGAYRALIKLRSEGVVKAIGAGMNQAEMLTRFAREGDFDCFLLAGRYTLIDHTGLKELLPVCVEKKISIIVGGPYNSGILATGAVEGATFNYIPAPPEIMEKVRRVEGVCARHHVPLNAAALQFPLAHPAIAAVIPGGRSPAEVEENLRLIEHPIPSDFWQELRTEKLIPDQAPTPG